MRQSLLSLFFRLLLAVSVVSALSASGSQLLVVTEDEADDKSKYSQYLRDLTDRGFQLTYRSPKDPALSLFAHGVPIYSHLLLLPIKAKGLGPALSSSLLVDFLNAGSNFQLALSSELPVPISVSNVLLELDISLPAERTSLVVDHFNYDSKNTADKHDVLLIPKSQFKQGVKNFFEVEGLIAFPRSVGHVLGNASPLLSPIIKAPSTAYTYNPKYDAEGLDDLFATGSQINIVSAFQARNSARFTILGSAELLQDKWFNAVVQLPGPDTKAEKASNRAFAQKLSAWTFKESGVLKVQHIQHYLNEGSQKEASNASTNARTDVNPSIYRIKNDVYYEIGISEWDFDRWIPFTPPAGDNLQLEFSMLSPFHRLNLKQKTQTATSSVYSTEFKLPDQHGIFNFFVEYRRPFYTNIEEKRAVTVRHLAHNEWPRSFVITGAWPWISGIWVTVVGWVVFVVIWLYSKPSETKLRTS